MGSFTWDPPICADALASWSTRTDPAGRWGTNGGSNSCLRPALDLFANPSAYAVNRIEIHRVDIVLARFPFGEVLAFGHKDAAFLRGQLGDNRSRNLP